MSQPWRLGRIFIGQWIITLIVLITLPGILGLLPFGWLYSAMAMMTWIIWPLSSFGSAALSTYHGVNSYLAWLAPLAGWLVSLAIWQLPYTAGPLLLGTLFAVVGAATGEVVRKRKK